MELEIRQCLRQAEEQRDSEALQAAYRLLGAGAPRIAPELFVVCAEVSLQLGSLEISTACLKLYFEENPPANQFLCQAYLCQGQLKTPPTTGSWEDFEEAVACFLKAIEISKHEQRFHFMVFNASVLYLQTVHPLLQPGRCHHLVPSLRQVARSLEEVANQDHGWRAELMMHLIKCLVDSGEVEEAADVARTTKELIKSQAPHLYPRLFMIMVQHKLAEGDVISKMEDKSSAVMYKLQAFKSRVKERNVDELMNEDSVELEEIFLLLADCTKESSAPENLSALQSENPITPADRVAYLLELALLALQVKHQKVAADCLKELKSAREASTGQRIIMECVSSEISLLKKKAKTNDYSKANVEAWLKEIDRLDQWLKVAVREGSTEAVPVVCATLWRFSLPLLQPNLRKHIKTPLLNVARVLEDTQSSLLGMRCQVHSELAAIEEEEGRFEASLTHLQKAILLDDGTQSERLLLDLHLRATLDPTPSRDEDKAAKLLQQTKDVQDNTNIRPILAVVGSLLGHEDFKIVLGGEDTSTIPVSGLESGPAAQLSAKAQHHSVSLQSMDGHLARRGENTGPTDRMKLWATLVKTARKEDIWDVCRAACRFCLLYDDERWKIPKADTKMKNDHKTDESRCSEEESCAESGHGCTERKNSEKAYLRLLAEICFISAEATVQKLLTEGVQLNSPAVPPQEKGACVSEEDPDWVIYRDWIKALSTYAISHFLRAAELGLVIGESWVVANAAVYLWNYSKHALASGQYQQLLPSFKTLVEMLQKMEILGNRTLVVLLCNAAARGLIQPLCGPDSAAPTLPGHRGKNKTDKAMEKASAAYEVPSDPAALQDVRKALELCDYALDISSCNTPGETVPIAVRKQLVATWVLIKWLLQQQISTKADDTDQCGNEGLSAMMRVLVGVEMLQRNRNPGHMEFSAPSPQALVSMASECSWTDAVVELQVWCQLAAVCLHAKDHKLVLRCTGRALQLQEAAAKSVNTVPCPLYDLAAVNELLSAAACLRGLSLSHQANGNLHAYRNATEVLLSSISFAEKAENPTLCVTVATHFWNACVPLSRAPEARQQLQDPLEKILKALVHNATKYAKKQVVMKGLPSLTTRPPGRPKQKGTDEQDLTLRAAICSLLLHIHADKDDWKGALQLLDRALRDMPHTRHRVPLLKSSVLVKARLGKDVAMDMQKLKSEGEQCCSFMWHQVALCAGDVTQQLTCYQKSISSLLSSETQWQKVNLLLEFGEWLYSHNFPKADAQQQVEWAIDILLHLKPERAQGADSKSKTVALSGVGHEAQFKLDGPFAQNLSSLKEVRQLDGLMQAHTLLAVMADRTSPEHQLNLLRAFTFVLQTWKVSMAVILDMSSEMSQQPSPSVATKKGKGKSKTKSKAAVKETNPTEEKPKPVTLDQMLPSSLKDWAGWICVDQHRQLFRSNSNPHCINKHCITKQAQSLFYLNLLVKELHSLSLDHMTLPVLHLAEIIAHDLLDKKSLSDVYRLRILRTCCQLGFDKHSPYEEELPDLCRSQEKEQMECHKVMGVSRERKTHDQEAKMDEIISPGQRRMSMCAQNIWLDKAELLLNMGFYQPVRRLLDEANIMASEFGDQKAMARSLLSLASLACEEQNHAQALILLERAQVLGGDGEFWHQLTVNKIRAVVGQKPQDAKTKVDQIVHESCAALKQVMEQQVNRASELSFFITSLEMRGAVERVRACDGGEPGETLCGEDVRMLTAACDTLRESASTFTQLNYRKQAAEAHAEHARALRVLANPATDKEEKQRLLLEGLSQMELAVTVQEEVVLRAQSLLPPQEETGIWLAAMQRLLHLRMVLAEFYLDVLDEHCAGKKCQALSREKKTRAEIALEEYSRLTPEPGSVEQQWVTKISTVGQAAVGQLSAVSFHSSHNVTTRARYLGLMGKYLRQLAVLEDPLYLCALWDIHKHKEAWLTVSVEEENSEREGDGESSRSEQRNISAKSAEQQQRRRRAQQLLAQATEALTEVIGLCLQHNLPASILAEAALDMAECHGQSEPAVTGQHLALFQSCSVVATIAGVLNASSTHTSLSQPSALLNLRRNLLGSEEERPGSMLKGAEDSLSCLSQAFRELTINPNHLNILAELPSNMKILLLQLSDDCSELYGAFYEMPKASESQRGKKSQVTGNLACSSVAKVSVSPQALLALREQVRPAGQDTTHALLKEACCHSAEGRDEASKKHHLVPQKTADEEKLAAHLCKVVPCMEDYLQPLLAQFGSCLRLQEASVSCLESNKSKDKEEKGNSDKPPAAPGECVVLLADCKLLELPLQSLSILQDDGLSSVSQDLSLQFLYGRMSSSELEKGGISTNPPPSESQKSKKKSQKESRKR